jgi:hypothetical protein
MVLFALAVLPACSAINGGRAGVLGGAVIWLLCGLCSS